MILLALDTATPRTAVALLTAGGAVVEAVHDPGPGERPGHASQALPLAERLLAGAGLRFADVDRVAVGTGPGGFTGLRIGIAGARALAGSAGAELVGVSSLGALAEPHGDRPVLAVIDARRGEAFVAGWAKGTLLVAPAALAPAVLEALAPPPGGDAWLAVGDGAVRFRQALARAGAEVPPDGDPGHRITAAATCRLGLRAVAGPPGQVVPEYLRQPDATPRTAP